MAEFIKVGEVSTYSEKETEMFLKAIENTEFSVCKETYSCDDDVPGDNFILMLKDKDDTDEEEHPTFTSNIKIKAGGSITKTNIDIIEEIINSYDHTCLFLDIDIIKEAQFGCIFTERVMSIVYEYNTGIYMFQSSDDIRRLSDMVIKRHKFITDAFSGEQQLEIYI